MSKETKYTDSEVLNMSGIVLEKENSTVNVRSGLLQSVSRNGSEVVLHITKHGSDKVMGIKANLRSIQYLNTKSVKRVRPFGESEFKTFLNSERGSMTPKYNFGVYALCEKSTGIAFGLTFKQLVPLTDKVFQQFLKGEKWNPIQDIPFKLGQTELPTKNGNLRVDFGRFNGNSGVAVTNPKGIKTELRAKHLGNSISQMCKTLKEIVSSEAIQKAETVEQIETILESFKPATM